MCVYGGERLWCLDVIYGRGLLGEGAKIAILLSFLQPHVYIYLCKLCEPGSINRFVLAAQPAIQVVLALRAYPTLSASRPRFQIECSPPWRWRPAVVVASCCHTPLPVARVSCRHGPILVTAELLASTHLLPLLRLLQPRALKQRPNPNRGVYLTWREQFGTDSLGHSIDTA